MAHLATSRNPLKNLDPSDPNSHLSKILIPRAPDTANNTFVRNYIISTLKALKWHIEEDSFTDRTPYGTKHFTNVIATKDPDAPSKFVLSAHFDSKFFSTFPENQFVGATDSAAPCAILLDLAETIDPLLNARKERLANNKGFDGDEEASETTLQLIFFDGEEAFKDWTATDSIYGAKHLATKWATTYLPPSSPKRRLNPQATVLDTIEHLVLLDLLGASNPLIKSYYLSTAWLFDALVSTEHRLGSQGLFDEPDQDKGIWHEWSSFFIPRTKFEFRYGAYVEDDHVPFLKKGVNILHIISEPFPRVWHTLKDDATALDLPTLKRWNLIFRIFTVEYLGLRLDSSSPSTRGNDKIVSRNEDELNTNAN